MIEALHIGANLRHVSHLLLSNSYSKLEMSWQTFRKMSVNGRCKWRTVLMSEKKRTFFFVSFFFLHEEATQFSANVVVVVVVVVRLFGGGGGVWVCSSVWLVKHSSYPNNKESRCRSCLSCVKPFGPFLSQHCVCVLLYYSNRRERERVRWCCIGTMFSRLFKLGPRKKKEKKDLISHDSLFSSSSSRHWLLFTSSAPTSSLLVGEEEEEKILRVYFEPAGMHVCALAHRRRFIYCPSSPANSTTGHNALKRCQTRFPSRVNNGGMDGMTTTHKQIESDETCQPRARERARERQVRCVGPRWTWLTERISGNERFIRYLARVYIFSFPGLNSSCIILLVFSLSVGPHIWYEGGPPTRR